MVKRAGAKRLTPEERREQLRERMLTVARQIFLHSGYAGTSILMITAEAGCTTGAFYPLFGSKEAICLELLAQHLQVQADKLARLVGEDASPEHALASLEAWLDGVNADTDWCLLALEMHLQSRRSVSFAMRYDALFSAHHAHLARLIERVFMQSGRSLPMPADVLADTLMALTHGLVIQQRRKTGEREPGATMIKVVMRRLLSDDAPTSDGSAWLRNSMSDPFYAVGASS